MCFGYEQNGQFDMALRCGARCLEVGMIFVSSEFSTFVFL